MTPEFTQEQVTAWRREGAVLMERVFAPGNVAAVTEVTPARGASRCPGPDLSPYRAAMEG